MTTDRPATHLWAAADRERQLIRNVQEAEWRRRMLRAGGIDPAQLSDQARRILAWLAEWDDWTVDGVAELLTAAHRAGLETARGEPKAQPKPPVGAGLPEAAVGLTEPGAADLQAGPGALRRGDTGVDAVKARLAAMRQRPENPAVGL